MLAVRQCLHKLSFHFSDTVLFLVGLGALGVKYVCFFTFYTTSSFSCSEAEFKQTTTRSQSQITTGKHRKHPSFHHGQKTNFLEPNTALSVLQVNHLTKHCLAVPPVDCKLMVLSGLFYVLPSDLLVLWALGQFGYYSEADRGNTSPVNGSKCNTIHKQK